MATSIGNQTVLITGASSGIGAACARRFAAIGARLILAARRWEPLQTLAAELQQQHAAEVLTVVLDVRQREAVSEAIAQLPEAWQAIDILINNAGLSRGLDKQYEAPLDDWEAMIDTNIKGLLYVTRAVVPGMVARGRGYVVNVGSIAGRQTYPGGSVYCATKAAVRSLSEGLKLDLLGTPVRVTNIDPGLVETEFSLVRFDGDRDRAQGVYQGMTPLTGDDVADVIVFAVTRPAHVNVSDVMLMPTAQASVFHTHRQAE
ncbi:MULTISPECIES: SDR family oxidoreductase [Cyanophyceae]|uniref:SDR family oxidoreductase n=1 Tax=Cyanophyceae TaxID=3028117 RepID=UPI001687A7B8|nr:MULTISPECIES: SDR family oxidoreductase [Cyanophyceae]MBD1916401.1 SDR family oxidoreductase [Phormidium sp. FACHB-77]MBD2032693.1 SDR family oxidoreductase [Phormidium sp. FACHB-322]MBD2050065.1 SDR family oxidoreductase [Leptolyngbya sp. FACHB-60]